MEIILGSGSPRRKQILESLGCMVTIVPPDVDESRHDNEPPESYVFRVLKEKTGFILDQSESRGDRVIITADTIVTIDGVILGKPVSRQDAVLMLLRLSGRTHRVITGLCLALIEGESRVIHTALEHTSVTFRELDDDTIGKYLDITEFSDKAGSYAVQENGDMIVKSVSGSMTNVIGFPLRLFFPMLVNAGLEHVLLEQ
ncbi:MAG TPA: Maf family protein [Spirochaetota bacterium]|nr:Maf family protein [Spirochaetota bacterium]